MTSQRTPNHMLLRPFWASMFQATRLAGPGATIGTFGELKSRCFRLNKPVQRAQRNKCFGLW